MHVPQKLRTLEITLNHFDQHNVVSEDTIISLADSPYFAPTCAELVYSLIDEIDLTSDHAVKSRAMDSSPPSTTYRRLF